MRTEKVCKTQIGLWVVRMRHFDKRSCDIVNRALVSVGGDFSSSALKVRLQKAVLLSCDDGRGFPYERLNVDFVSKRDFFYRREKFLHEIYTHFSTNFAQSNL